MQEELAEENRNLVEAQKQHVEARESLESRETGATCSWDLGYSCSGSRDACDIIAVTEPTMMYLKGLVNDVKKKGRQCRTEGARHKIFHFVT